MEIVIGVLTLLFGAVVSAIIGHALKAQKDRVKLRRAKFEALSLASGQIRRQSLEWFDIWHCIILGSMSLQRANGLQNAKAKDVGDSFDTVAALIRAHFPDLLPELEKCEAALSSFTACLPLFRKKLEEESKLSDYDHKASIEIMVRLQDSADDLARAIARYGQRTGLIDKARERSPFDRY